MNSLCAVLTIATIASCCCVYITLQEKQELLLESYVWSSHSVVHSILSQAKAAPTATATTATNASTDHNNNSSGNNSSSDSSSTTTATRAVTRRSAAKAAVTGSDGVSDIDVTAQWPQLAATLAMCDERQQQVQQLDVAVSSSSGGSSSNSTPELLAVHALLAKVLSVAAERVAALCLGQLKLSFEFADQVTRLLQLIELSIL
jgi:hypothetical protein